MIITKKNGRLILFLSQINSDEKMAINKNNVPDRLCKNPWMTITKIVNGIIHESEKNGNFSRHPMKANAVLIVKYAAR